MDEQLKENYDHMIEWRMREIKILTIEIQEIKAMRDAVDNDQQQYS